MILALLMTTLTPAAATATIPTPPSIPQFSVADCQNPDRARDAITANFASGEIENAIRSYGVARQEALVARFNASKMSVDERGALMHQLGGSAAVREAVAAGQHAWDETQPWYEKLKTDPRGAGACMATAHVSQGFSAMLAASQRIWDVFDAGIAKAGA
ncbi:hypothetical protein [Novosphingobium sp. 9]|uniref:hypothetical protein n=1 Tax=Novosphingobium sp. 9 TaxID=2025349 RepID=UPI0021B5099E|nr:hypothetical protein [Novosphingobium sp. 9]